MKNILELYAKYSKDTDNEIIRLLSAFSEEELKQERKMYVKSLYNLFVHLARAEWYYQSAINKITDGKYFKALQDRESFLMQIETSFAEAVKAMQKLDSDLVEFADIIPEEDFNLSIAKLTIYNGRNVEVSIWEIITQLMTHQIHHRGQIAQVLDELGIENDFGGVWPFIKDSQSK
jgi:uncharacterized damage-inducible protein DinB